MRKVRLRNGRIENLLQVEVTYQVLQAMTKAQRREVLCVARGAPSTSLMEEKGMAFNGRIPSAVRNTILSAVKPDGTLQQPWE